MRDESRDVCTIPLEESANNARFARMRSRRYCKTPGPVSSLILAFSAPATPLLLPVALFRALVVSLPASRMGVGAATIPAVRLIPLPVPSPPRLRLWFLPPAVPLLEVADRLRRSHRRLHPVAQFAPDLFRHRPPARAGGGLQEKHPRVVRTDPMPLCGRSTVLRAVAEPVLGRGNDHHLPALVLAPVQRLPHGHVFPRGNDDDEGESTAGGLGVVEQCLRRASPPPGASRARTEGSSRTTRGWV